MTQRKFRILEWLLKWLEGLYWDREFPGDVGFYSFRRGLVTKKKVRELRKKSKDFPFFLFRSIDTYILLSEILFYGVTVVVVDNILVALHRTWRGREISEIYRVLDNQKHRHRDGYVRPEISFWIILFFSCLLIYYLHLFTLLLLNFLFIKCKLVV